MSWRNTRAEVDLDVVENNARILSETFAPAEFCAVIKADAYGHGAIEVGRAALRGGATHLAVALVEEGIALREAGIDAPVLILSEPRPAAMRAVVEAGLTPAIYTHEGLNALFEVTADRVGFPVHVKVDTGMHRVGAQPDDAASIAQRIAESGSLTLQGVFTHFANASDSDQKFSNSQVAVFDEVIAQITAIGAVPEIVHIANTSGGLIDPTYRRAMVRSGAALYGFKSSPNIELPEGIKPAMSIKAEVTLVKRSLKGSGFSYGQTYLIDRDSNMATVSIGYADGLPWLNVHQHGDVLIGGKLRRIAGSVTMDQIVVDCGDDWIEAGQEVVIIGTQDGLNKSVEALAQQSDTIAYEVLCRLGPRLPRVYVGNAGSN